MNRKQINFKFYYEKKGKKLVTFIGTITNNLEEVLQILNQLTKTNK